MHGSQRLVHGWRRCDKCEQRREQVMGAERALLHEHLVRKAGRDLHSHKETLGTLEPSELRMCVGGALVSRLQIIGDLIGL